MGLKEEVALQLLVLVVVGDQSDNIVVGVVAGLLWLWLDRLRLNETGDLDLRLAGRALKFGTPH